MRIDKFLKNSRLIKRRTVAKEACDGGRVSINDKVAKAGDEVKIGDIIEIRFGTNIVRAKILDVPKVATKENASEMYEIVG
jgi:ribosomal 50S subunit-recycling heat shock protein